MRLTMEGPALPCRSRSSSMVVKMSNLFQMPGSCSDVKLRYLARMEGMESSVDSIHVGCAWIDDNSTPIVSTGA